MFAEVRIFNESEGNKPNKQELDQLLLNLNSGKFIERQIPDDDLEKSIIEIRQTCNIQKNCHDVALKLSSKLKFTVVYGYLALSRTSAEYPHIPICLNPEINRNLEALERTDKQSQASRIRELASLMRIVKGKGVLKLLHHAVVADHQGKCIECLQDQYPVTVGVKEEEYVFFPHESGQLGCTLEAHYFINS